MIPVFAAAMHQFGLPVVTGGVQNMSRIPIASAMVVGKEFGSITVGAAVTKGNTKLGDAIKASFASMNKSGDYNAILKKWNMSSLAYKF